MILKLTGRKSIGLGLCAFLVSAWALPVAAAGKIKIDDTRWVSVGAGMRTSYKSVEDGAPSGDDRSSDFEVENIRLYINGQAHEKVKFTFNSECLDCGSDESEVIVLDAIVQFGFNDSFNVWMGRLLTPADRIEMNGPFYGINWNQYTVPLFPSDQDPLDNDAGRIGRDDGVTVWGSFDKFQYAVGGYSGYRGDANQKDSLLFAGRFAYNFLNKEKNPGYYTSSTYFGSLGNVFTVAAFIQSQSDGVGTATESADFLGYGVDALFEKVFGDAGVLTLEGEYKKFDVDLTATMVADPDCFCLFNGDSYFVTAAYLFSKDVGPGKFQPYVRYTSTDPDDSFNATYDDSDLTEIGLNYIVSGHDVQLNLNYTNGDANSSGLKGGEDVNAVLFGVQVQF